MYPTLAKIPAHARFGAVRRHDIHTGIDLHCPEGTEVYAIEQGEVVRIEPFTGAIAGSPWWNNTWAVHVKTSNGYTLVYGEVISAVHVGDIVKPGDLIGTVTRVLINDKGLPTSMLHLEQYSEVPSEGTVWWKLGEPQPTGLMDPSRVVEGCLKSWKRSQKSKGSSSTL